jgi:hypothetical protein
MQENELKRLRREHVTVQRDLEKTTKELADFKETVQDVVKRQGLNDDGMATLFKLSQIQNALEM